MRAVAVILVGGWAAVLAPLTAGAHPAVPTSAEATVEADGRFRMVAHFDTLAFVLNDTSARIGNEPMEALLAASPAELAAQLAEAKERFLHGFRVTTDHGPGRVEGCEFPTADEVSKWKATIHPALPVELPVRLSGHLPVGAGTVAFRFPDVLEQAILTVERPEEEPFAEQVGAGEPSSALPIRATVPGAKAASAGKRATSGQDIRTPFWRSRWAGLACALSVLGLSLLPQAWRRWRQTGRPNN